MNYSISIRLNYHFVHSELWIDENRGLYCVKMNMGVLNTASVMALTVYRKRVLNLGRI